MRMSIFYLGLLLCNCALAATDLQKMQSAYKKMNYAEALKYAIPLAEKGNVHAQFRLGFMYLYGEGLEKNDTQAISWLEKAAKQGDVESAYSLGRMLYARDEKKSARYFRQILKSKSKAHIALLQQFLNNYGYNVGKPDGQPGQKTVAALNTLAASGKINARSDMPSLLGVKLPQIERFAMRKLLHEQQVPALREQDNHWSDQYDSSTILPGSEHLTLTYSFTSNQLASAVYKIPTANNPGIIADLIDSARHQFGRADRKSSSDRLGNTRYSWNKNTVLVRITRKRGDAYGYLSYEVKRIQHMVKTEQAESQKLLAKKKSRKKPAKKSRKPAKKPQTAALSDQQNQPG